MAQDPNNTKSLGCGMTIAGWLIVLFFLTIFFNNQLAQKHNPNIQFDASVTENGVREIVLQRNPMGHYLVRGEINGVKVDFMLDTGATDVAIPAAFAHRMNLPFGPEQIYNTANGHVRVHQTRIDTLKLGPIEVHDVAASINPGMSEDIVLLGMSFLKHVEFSQKGKTLTLRQ